MDGMYSTALALRAIIAVFLERTLGRGLAIATIIAVLVAALAAYNAAHGAALLWVICTLASALGFLLLLLTAVTFFAVYRLLPRHLSFKEKRRIIVFSKTLLQRLEMARLPIPLLAWHLVVQTLTNQQDSEQKQHLQSTIEHSHSLNHQFKTIRSFFEIK